MMILACLKEKPLKHIDWKAEGSRSHSTLDSVSFHQVPKYTGQLTSTA